MTQFIYKYRITSDPSKQPVIVSESPFNTKKDREKMAQFFLETLNVPSFCLIPQPHLSLLSTGKTTGLVVNMGYEPSYLVPIYEGLCPQHSILTQSFGSSDISKYLSKLLSLEHHSSTSVDDLMEKYCYIALDYEYELNKSRTTSDCKVHTKNNVLLNDERFTCPELYFKPYLNGFKDQGISNIVLNSIYRCENDIQISLLNSIVLSGGPSMFNRLKDRLQKEITNLVQKSTHVNVVADPKRKIGTFIGASILGSNDDFDKYEITNDDYYENGKYIVNIKNRFL